MENIISAAWIPTFGILYSLLAAVVFNTVWGEYKAMRTAVKRYDLETFIDLRDEEISPLIYTMMTVFSMSLLCGFMSLKYPTVKCGLIIICSTGYLLSLIFLVVKEIDDPCGGIWFIRSIPKEWLTINAKVWRRHRQSREKKKFQELFTENGVHLEALESRGHKNDSRIN